MSNPNYSTLLTLAIESRNRELADNLSKSNAIFYALKEHDGIKPFDGGTKILEEVMHAENPNSGSYAGSETLSLSDVDFASAAEFAIKQYRASVLLNGLQLAQVSGKARLIELVSSAVKNAQVSAINDLVAGIYSDGTGNGGKDITGLQAALTITPTTGTYGGINRATASWWRQKAVSGTAITSANVLAKFQDLYTQVARGTEHADVIVACTTHYNALWTAMQANQRFTESSSRLAKAGFNALRFNMADVVLENDASTGMPTDKSYFLTTEYIKFRPYKSLEFKEFGTDPHNIDAMVKHLKLYGNLTCSRLAAQGVLSDA